MGAAAMRLYLCSVVERGERPRLYDGRGVKSTLMYHVQEKTLLDQQFRTEREMPWVALAGRGPTLIPQGDGSLGAVSFRGPDGVSPVVQVCLFSSW